MKTLLLYSFTGLVAGFINGLFGTGGALPLLALFAFLSFDTDKAFATANLVVMILSAVSFFLYLANKTVEISFLPHYFSDVFLPALLGGAVGSLMLSKLSPTLLKKIFFVITVIGGVGTVFR
jgi:uncharacterized membrane protein YfcA